MDPFASRLAARCRWPVALIGAGCIGLVAADLAGAAPHRATAWAAAIVAGLAAVIFVSAVFDMRLQRALSALNAERRAQARRRGWLARVTGIGLPIGDRVLAAIAGLLLIEVLVAGGRDAATALSFAGFFLVTVTHIALMVRGYPTDTWIPRG